MMRIDRRIAAPRPARLPALAAGLAILILLASCGGSGPGTVTGPEAPLPDLWPDEVAGSSGIQGRGCDILAGPASPGGRFLIALTDTIRPDRAPIPHNRSERLLFNQLYETLVRVDCSGDLQPGLAESWTCTEDSTVWVFRLRENARFWDGTRVTADDVRRAWAGSQSCPRSSGRSSPWTWFDSRARSISTLDARRLAIRLPEPQARFPYLLAHPATAIAAEREGWTWKVGSGPCRLRASDPAPRPDLECRPNSHHPDAPAWKKLTFRIMPGADPRDLLTEDPDLALVRDLEDVRFYEDATGFSVAALPWDRLYLLVMPPEANPGGTGAWRAAARNVDPERDVTGVSSRSWDSIVLPAGGREACPQMSGPVNTGSSARLEWGLDRLSLDGDTVVFPGDDTGAREFAHRLAALAGGRTRAVPMPPEALCFALQWQMPGAVVLPLDLDFPTGCLQLATLLGKAAWLQEAALDNAPAPVPNSLGDADRLAPRPGPRPTVRLVEGGHVRPLGLNRPWLVSRGELGGLVLEFDGTPRLSGLGRAVADQP